MRLEEMALADRFDYLVSSFDIGLRKPDRAMFDAALERASCRAHECVMVGDSEPNDIQPAARLGMRTIRVTIQYPVAGEVRWGCAGGGVGGGEGGRGRRQRGLPYECKV